VLLALRLLSVQWYSTTPPTSPPIQSPASKYDVSTGGTCFLTMCDTTRSSIAGGVECTQGILGWRECTCREPTPRAHPDGKCYPHGEFGSGLAWRLRTETPVLLALAIVTVGRSGVMSPISSFFGISKIVGASKPITTSFGFDKSWGALKDDLDFKRTDFGGLLPEPIHFAAYSSSVIKFIFLHVAQAGVLGFTFFAYYAYLGPFQLFFASVSLIKEMW